MEVRSHAVESLFGAYVHTMWHWHVCVVHLLPLCGQAAGRWTGHPRRRWKVASPTLASPLRPSSDRWGEQGRQRPHALSSLVLLVASLPLSLLPSSIHTPYFFFHSWFWVPRRSDGSDKQWCLLQAAIAASKDMERSSG